MFPTNGSESAGVMAVGVGALTGGVHGLPCGGGGAEIAGGGIHDFTPCAGGECAAIEAGPLDELPKCDDAADAETPGGCHATPGANPFALRDSSLALTTPYVKQPMIMQISAPNNATPKSNPTPRITV